LQDNTTVSLAQGQELVVSLPANPSTGFIWEIEALPAYVATEGAPAYVSGVKQTTPALVGVSGEMTFTFRATRATSGTLELAYHRPWEQKPATRTYRLTLNAK
jgi:inhibitor of cysteine peptidase